VIINNATLAVGVAEGEAISVGVAVGSAEGSVLGLDTADGVIDADNWGGRAQPEPSSMAVMAEAATRLTIECLFRTLKFASSCS
jgi:hypothetical protein